MSIMPEAVILFGAAIVAWVVSAVRERWPGISRLAVIGWAFGLGVAVSVVLYAAGVVETAGATTVQLVGKALLAGVAMAMSASGGQSQLNVVRDERKRTLASLAGVVDERHPSG